MPQVQVSLNGASLAAGDEMHVGVRLLLLEVGKARNEPADRERRPDADGHPAPDEPISITCDGGRPIESKICVRPA